MVTRAAKDLLRNTIRNTDFHNRLLQENEMWKSWEVEKGLTMMMTDDFLRKRMEAERALAESTGQLRMDCEVKKSRQRKVMQHKELRKQKQAAQLEMGEVASGTYWTRRLMEVEEKDPDRWGHAGFKELYPEKFRSDRSESISEDSDHSSKKKKKKRRRSKVTKEKKKKKKKSKRRRSESDHKHSKHHSPKLKKKKSHSKHSSRRKQSRSPVVHSRGRSSSKATSSSHARRSSSRSESRSRSRTSSSRSSSSKRSSSSSSESSVEFVVKPYYQALSKSGTNLSDRFQALSNGTAAADDSPPSPSERPSEPFTVQMVPTSSTAGEATTSSETLTQKRTRLLAAESGEGSSPEKHRKKHKSSKQRLKNCEQDEGSKKIPNKRAKVS